MKTCPFCAEDIQDAALVCKHCGRELIAQNATPAKAIGHPPRGRLLGFIGAGLLAIGVFTPIVRLPIVGTINYFRNGSGDGTVILVIAALAALAAAVQRIGWLLPCGVTSIGLLTVVWLSLRERMADIQRSTDRSLADNPFRGIVDAMSQSVQLEWGWAVMVAGAGLLLVAAFIDRKRPSWFAIGATVFVLVPLSLYAYIEL
jgi:hypothetical protein